MEFLYGYSVAAELRPGTRYDEVVEALGGHGELVERPDQLRAGARACVLGGQAGARERADRPRGRLPAAVEPRLSCYGPRAGQAQRAAVEDVVLGDLDALEARTRASPRRAGSSPRRSWARGPGSARRPRGAASSVIVGEPREQQFDGRERRAGSRARARGRRGRAPGRSTPPRWRCRRPRSRRSTAARSLRGQARREARARTSAASSSQLRRGGRVGVDVALAHAHDAGVQRDVKAGACAPTPTTNSVEPPPMSITTVASFAARAARHRAEERELGLLARPLSTRASSPKSSRTRAANSAPLEASRTAEVSTAMLRSQRWLVDLRAVLAQRARRPARTASSESAPLASTPAPETRHLRASHELLDGTASAGSTSAISSRVEFVPMSTTATRTAEMLASQRCAGRRPRRPSAGAPASGLGQRRLLKH